MCNRHITRLKNAKIAINIPPSKIFQILPFDIMIKEQWGGLSGSFWWSILSSLLSFQ